MNPVKDKVKDIVDVRNYKSLKDFSSSPRETLESYHFTDITAEMMAKWLDRISVVPARGGAAFALAGYRGVGKSHFLAVLGAIVSHTELRSGISDQLVLAGAQRLLRRHYPVIHVRRGTEPTLIEEIEAAVQIAFPDGNFGFDGSLGRIIAAISDSTGDMPAVLLIDTAFERGMRVARDDGAVLGELGQLVTDQNIFLGVALDDDISGADGLNADIARTFTIDYLDQEHLYTVVNVHVFPKLPTKQAVLKDVYQFFRTVLPNFRWSEQKFNSLYPLHPAILDVAPFVRLHVHDFALLSFASEAGERILGRPATSLIALDEVFDKVESNLRGIEDLRGAFTAYDTLNEQVVTKIPVMQRLQAKLILKALMLLSLDGQGSSAAEIAQSMLIYDESDPEKAIRTVEELISMFTAALPQDVQVTTAEGRETKYGFRITSKDNLNLAIDEAVEKCTPEAVSDLLMRLFKERFPETVSSSESSDSQRDLVDCSIVWRGSVRRGRLRFASRKGAAADGSAAADLDWEVKVEFFTDPENGDEETAPRSLDEIVWHPGKLTLSEYDTLRRYHVLVNDLGLRSEFADQIQAPLHSHAVAAARVFKRAVLEDGILAIEGFDYNFTEEARETASLRELLSLMLETLFETRFPEHPEFGSVLGPQESAGLISGFYGGTTAPGTEQAILDFAVPLGLARLNGDRYERPPFDQLAELPYITNVISLATAAGEATVSLDAVAEELGKAPYGLGREAQRLILASLVSERKIDFVTSKGDRINHRSLDLRLIWDDIVGIASTAEAALSTERLLKWASLLTDGETFTSFTDKAQKEKLRNSLTEWLESWKKSRILERFEAVPDDLYNTRIWRTASYLEKSFNSFADAVAATVAGDTTLDECVSRIAAIFADSEDEYQRKTGELLMVEEFVRGTELFEQVMEFTAKAEFTFVEDVEIQRKRLMETAELCILDPGDTRNREAWYHFDKFRKDYSKLYTAAHDLTMLSHQLQEQASEFYTSRKWADYTALLDAGLMDAELEVREIRSRLRQVGCTAPASELAQAFGECRCGFSLQSASEWEELPLMIEEAVTASLERFSSRMSERSGQAAEGLKTIISSGSPDKVLIASSLLSRIEAGRTLPMTPPEAMVLAEAIGEKRRFPARHAEPAYDNVADPEFQAGELLSIEL